MMAVVTAQMAIADARLEGAAVDPARVGVVFGSTGTGYLPPADGVDDHFILRSMANAPATWVSLLQKYRGPAFVVSTACASAGYALGSAYSLITSGQCDVVIAGGADSMLNRAYVQGFCSLLALAEGTSDFETASRPFDRQRRGFVIGEGAGVLVLESFEFARRRGARILATMPLPGLCSEAYNILSPQRDGAGMAEAMRLALENAGLRPEQIDYLNAHGTSTPLNDLYESLAIKTVFGPHAARLPVSSTKSMTGHCLSAASGVEAVICCKALQEGMVPPTLNLTDPDPALDLDFVPLAARRLSLHHVMSNSFAFGGHNGVNVFSRWE